MMRRILKIFIPLSLCVMAVVAVIIFLRPSNWDGSSRFRFVLVDKTNQVAIAMVVPTQNEIQIATVDPTIEVSAAYGLGTWKVGSLWALGEQEKMGGAVLVKNTLIQSLSIPVQGIWKISSFSSMGKWSFIGALLHGAGDLPLGTRIRLAFFALKAPIGVSSSLLGQNNFGFFAMNPINEVDGGVIYVVNRTESKSKYLDSLQNLISNMGGKVLDVSDQSLEEGVCEVRGQNSFTKNLATILGCKLISGSPQQITINSGFLARY